MGTPRLGFELGIFGHARHQFIERHGGSRNELFAILQPGKGQNPANQFVKAAGFKFGVHPHMLRHATRYKLANDGHDTRSLQAYLGHKNIQHTVRYTEMSPTRFKDFWRD